MARLCDGDLSASILVMFGLQGEEYIGVGGQNLCSYTEEEEEDRFNFEHCHPYFLYALVRLLAAYLDSGKCSLLQLEPLVLAVY
jgi:hypothetical protein